MAYLNESGLQRLWEKIKNKIKSYVDIAISGTGTSYIRQEQYTVYASVQNQTEIKIQSVTYNWEIDILSVYINGLHATEGIDYEKTAVGIILKKGLDLNGEVTCFITRSIMATQESIELLRGERGPEGKPGNFTAKKIQAGEDINVYIGEEKVGLYFAGGGNGIKNKPNGVDAFYLEVNRSADGYYYQLMIPSNQLTNTLWMRSGTKTAWGNWVEKGKNGAPGKSFTYSDMTETEKKELLSHVSVKLNRNLIRRTVETNEQKNFSITGYNPEADALDVYVSGMHMIENVDYTATATQIVFVKGLDKGAEIHVIIQKISGG